MDLARGSMTPLHIGAYFGHYTIVRLLCERGADPLLQTTTRKLPVDLVPSGRKFNELRAYLRRITAAAQLTAKDGLTTILNGIAIVAVRLQTTIKLGTTL
jgi:ankyrin repeat protein